jgi:DNA mismatch repair protein MutL
LPARRKFLRSEETESAHIQHYLTLAALAYPEVAFTYIKDTRVVWQLAASKHDSSAKGKLNALQERMRTIMGSETQLLSVDFTAELEEQSFPEEGIDEPTKVRQFRVWGLIGQPGVSRGTREDQHLFVNRRPVENRTLNFALLEGYHTALMKGRFPVCCLFVEVDPSTVDVNIHPSKREIKFHNDRAIRRLTAEAIKQTLVKFHGGSTGNAGRTVEQPSLPAIPATRQEEQQAATPELPSFAAPSSRINFPWPSLQPSTATARQPETQTSPSDTSPKPGLERPVSAPVEAKPEERSQPLSIPAPALPPRPAEPTPLLHVPMRLVGVVGKLYVVLESDRGLVLMDQHAAHERILFEQMLNRLETGTAPSQRLLLPETVELSVRDANFVRDLLPTLNRLGVGLSEFGERTFLLDALPPFVKVADARRFVLELVDEIKSAGQEVNSMRLGEHMIAKTVCRHAVKANDPLAGPELENLVNDLHVPTRPPHAHRDEL